MVTTYYPHSKKIHNFKIQNLNLKKTQSLFKIKKFHESFTTRKWGVMCMKHTKKFTI
jgi:hypothetical protein